VGSGANADNIRGCLELLRDQGYTGALSIECEGQGGPMIEESLAWMRATLTELKIPIDD
jgi:sugar phosphate isomerase/epimerase